MNLRTIGIAFVGAVAVVAVSAGVVAQQATPSGPIPPPPPYPGYTPPANSVPIVRSTPAARGKAKPSSGATETPAPPQFTNLSGIWEVEAQPGGAQTLYTHLRLQQNADNTITGYWERGKQELPFNGNFDGRQFKLVVQDGKTQTTFAGYEDNFSDMVGLIDKGDGKPVAFTASHRKKSDFLNGINIGPGIGGAAQGNGF